MALIGFCGAHRTGKTTLAKQFAKANGFVYVDASVSKCLSDAGLDSSSIQTLDIHEFVLAQNLVLNHIVTLAEELAPDPKRTYVMDRTPIDALIYYRAYFSGKFFYEAQTACSEQFNLAFQDYVNRAHDACRRFYTAIFGVQPGIEVKAEHGKALATDAFIEQLNALVVGEIFTFSEHLKTLYPYCAILNHAIIDLDERVATVNALWTEALALSLCESKICDRPIS